MSNRKKLKRVQKRKQKLAKRENESQKRKTGKAAVGFRKRDENLFFLAESLRKGLRRMWTQEKIEAMTTEDIIKKLNEFRIDFDEAMFRSTLQDFYSPIDLAEDLWGDEIHSIKGQDVIFRG